MKTGARFPLERFERAIHTDESVVGVLYTGSLGSGRADAFSDLDITVVFDGVDPREAGPALLQHLGEVRFRYWRGSLLTALVGDDRQRVDLECLSVEQFRPDRRYTGAMLLKGMGHRIRDVLERSRFLEAASEPGPVRIALARAIDSQIYVALHNARGAVWSAMGEVAHRSAELYSVLAGLRGHSLVGCRSVETVLSEEERRKLEEAWPRGPQRDEVRRAARALWLFTQVVRSEASAVFGSDLWPELDDVGLLCAVDKIYTRKKA